MTNLPWRRGRTGRTGVWPGHGTMRGREDELRAVLKLARGAAKARGGVLLIEGELGAGKSMLLSRAASAAENVGVAVAAAAAESSAGSCP